MIVLVRCADTTVSVALASRVELLVSEGQITAYLGPDGWVEAKSQPPRSKSYPAPAAKSRCTAFVSF